MSINNAPARYEGPYSQLGALIRKEAEKHLVIAEQAAESVDPNAREMHFLKIENGVWEMLRTGWARPLEDWSGMVFWNPFAREFLPWTHDLMMVYVELNSSIRRIAHDASDTYTGQHCAAPMAGSRDYTGHQKFLS